MSVHPYLQDRFQSQMIFSSSYKARRMIIVIKRPMFMPDATSGGFLLDFCLYRYKIKPFIHHFATHGRGLPLGNALRYFRHKQDFYSGKHNLEILYNARMSYVHQIHSQFVVRSSIVLAINLCIPSQSSLSLQAQGEFRHSSQLLSCNLRRSGRGQRCSSHPSRYL